MKQFSWKNKTYNLLSCIIFILLWEFIATSINNEIYLPKIESILQSTKEIVLDLSLIHI